MYKLLILIVPFLCLTSCAKGITPEELALFEQNGLDGNIADRLKGDFEGVEQLMTYNDEFQPVEAKGVVLKVAPDSGYEAVERVRGALAGSQHQAYLYENHFGDEQDYLEIVKTNGVNYDISAQQVREQYAAWKPVYDLALIGAGMDWLEARVQAKNSDWAGFAEEVYKFCPDVVDQGTGTVENLAQEMERVEALYCWWD